jgi:hypothetical protein
MTLFSDGGLLFSLPGSEVEKIDWRGTVAESHEILGAPLSPELRLAIRVVREAATQNGIRMLCVARPEMFCGEEAADWLRRHTRGFSQHLYMSDGVTIKTLPGYKNHVFFYSLSLSSHITKLRRLIARAPEILVGIDSQVNTRIAVRDRRYDSSPKASLIWRTKAQASPNFVHWPFFLNISSLEDTVARILQHGAIEPSMLAGFTSARYIPLTSAALADQAFVSIFAHIVQQVYFKPKTLLLVRLPFSRPDEDPLSAGVALVLNALRSAGVVIPRMRANNIFFVSDDVEEYHSSVSLPPLQITVHESFDFWRHTKTFYEIAADVTVLVSRGGIEKPEETAQDVMGIYGPRAQCHWMPTDFNEVGSFRIFAH